MTTTKEDQIRAEFYVWHNSDIPQFNGELKYNDVDMPLVDVWKACAESYENKLAEKDAEYQAQRAAARDNKDWFDSLKADYDEKCKQLSEANARNAMLVEALQYVDDFYCFTNDDKVNNAITDNS